MEEYLTKGELAKLLKVSEVTVDRWRKEGLPCIKIKRKVLFDQEEVQRWLKKKSQ
jgi:excisionase family DNA binding protein